MTYLPAVLHLLGVTVLCCSVDVDQIDPRVVTRMTGVAEAQHGVRWSQEAVGRWCIAATPTSRSSHTGKLPYLHRWMILG